MSNEQNFPVCSPCNDIEIGTSQNASVRDPSCISGAITFAQKMVAESIATFLLIFLGCGSVIVDKKSDGSISHFGISAVWGMAVTMMSYSVGHISGAHLNSAVTIANAVTGRFPWKQVPAYVAVQVSASIAAGFVLRAMFGNVAHIGATVPSGSDTQSFFMEFIITFCLMFVISGVSSDDRAIQDLGGIVVGLTVAATVALAGPVSGASLNPSRSIGSAVAGNQYKSIWIYMVAPTLGAIIAACSYELLKFKAPLQPSSFSSLCICAVFPCRRRATNLKG